jgi:lysophospholipase L1-like esterase
MKNIPRSFFLALVTTVALSVQAEQPAPELPKVVLLGDSIRAGYKDTVIKALDGKASVWTPKENCKSSVYTRENLAKWMEGQKPDVIHLNAGLHDLVLTGSDTTFTEIGKYKENILAIVEELKKNYPDAKIIWATTTPVVDELNEKSRASGTADGKRVARRENAQVIRFNEAAEEALKGRDIVVDDLYTAVKDMNDQDLYIEDGVHFSMYGREFLGDLVAKSILAQLPKP